MIGIDAARTPLIARSARLPRVRPASGPGHDRARRPAASRADLLRRGRRQSPTIYTPIDDKPKRADDPLALARVRDIDADPRVTVLVDRWDEDWTRLAWLRGEGRATVLEHGAAPAEHAAAVTALRFRYPQYATHRLDQRPLIRITFERVVDWGSAGRGRS